MSTKIKLITSESKDFDDVLSSIREHQTCRNQVGKDYIKYTIESDTVSDVLIIGSIEKINGFACLTRNSTYLQIKLLCTETNNLYYGYDLMLHIVDFCKSLKKNYIFVDSVPSAVEFYRSFGFKRGTTKMDSISLMSDRKIMDEDDDYDNPMFLDIRKFDAEKIKKKVSQASLVRDYPSLFDF